MCFIAIVSDSFASAMSRSEPLFLRARVDLIAEYEPLLPKLQEEEGATVGVPELMEAELETKGLKQPNSCQYAYLQIQEGFIATGSFAG